MTKEELDILSTLTQIGNRIDALPKLYADPNDTQVYEVHMNLNALQRVILSREGIRNYKKYFAKKLMRGIESNKPDWLEKIKKGAKEYQKSKTTAAETGSTFVGGVHSPQQKIKLINKSIDEITKAWKGTEISRSKKSTGKGSKKRQIQKNINLATNYGKLVGTPQEELIDRNPTEDNAVWGWYQLIYAEANRTAKTEKEKEQLKVFTFSHKR